MPEETTGIATPPGAEFDAQDIALRARISGIVGRDEAEFAALYDATASRLYTLALRIVGDRGAAEEVVSDVFLQVWEQAHRYDPGRAKVMHWLYMICRSRALDLLRRRENAETSGDASALIENVESADGDPQQILMSVQAGSAVHAALLTLTDSQQRLVALAFFRDMSHQEIADIAGMPLGTVKSTLRRALLTLREMMQTKSELGANV